MALGALISLAIVGLFLADLQTRYWGRIAIARQDARNFANILAVRQALTFEDVDRVLLQAEAVRETSLSGKFDPAVTDAACASSTEFVRSW